MVDLSFIGKEGLIIQYEDIVSLIGFNIMKYFRSKKVNDVVNRMSIQDVLLSYINRESESVPEWIKKTFGIDCDIDDYMESINALQPNMLYSYKVFDSAYKNGVKNLVIHSNKKSEVIEKMLETYQLPIEYTYGDIVPVLKARKNYTYMTSLPSNIYKCLNDVDVPFALTIVDDFMYTADIIINKVDEALRKHGVYVCYTSILSAGII